MERRDGEVDERGREKELGEKGRYVDERWREGEERWGGR
jgi:hypothetical protein